jgi:tRNA nucleotidyltransferase (CCA-adding enzyme)
LNIIIPEFALIVLHRLMESGFESYIVGGCVRDSVLGQSPKDYDITTSARPEEVVGIFESFTVIETGLKHGTVTVMSAGSPVEVTTFRTDGDYLDNRRPSSVRFCGTLREDLSRRDFTCNAIAYSPQSGIIDYFGGLSDIENKIIRAVGNPRRRFEEDSLRILRAMRFSSRLGFEIDRQTSDDMHLCRSLLSNISGERIFAELSGILMGENAREIILQYHDILSEFIPSFSDMAGFRQNNPYHIYDVLTHTAVAVERAEPRLCVRLAALLHDVGKPACYFEDADGVGHFYGHAEESVQIAREVFRRLPTDNFTKERVIKLIKYHDAPISPDHKQIKRMLLRHGEEFVSDLIELEKADALAQSPEYHERIDRLRECGAMLREIVEQNECFSLRRLAIGGRDVISLGVPSGKRVGEILTALLSMVVEEKVSNTPDKLREAAIGLIEAEEQSDG